MGKGVFSTALAGKRVTPGKGAASLLSNDMREVFTLDRSEPLKNFGVFLWVGKLGRVVVGN